MRENQIGVGIGLDVEVDGEFGLPVIGVQRIHVFHVVHAAHHLLDGSGDGLVQRHGIGTGVGGGDLNLRIGDIRELRGGQDWTWRPDQQ